MKQIAILLILVIGSCAACFAQEKMNPGGMSYIYNPKPNSILYHDTLYRGSKQFGQLFYRTRDVELIQYYQKHQSNKILGQIIGILGTATTIVGISSLSPNSNISRGVAWSLVGGGFVASLAGSYMVFMGQRNLQMAVELFNAKHSRGAAGIGLGGQQAGLVYAF